MIDIAEKLAENPHANLVLFKDLLNKAKGAMFITKSTYNVTTIDNFVGKTHNGYGVVVPKVVDYTDYEVSIENEVFTLHTIRDKLLRECRDKGRYLILNHYTNTYVEVEMPEFRAIEATLKYSSYKFKDIIEGKPKYIEVIKLAPEVGYKISYEDTYPEDRGCGMYTMVVNYITPSI